MALKDENEIIMKDIVCLLPTKSDVDVETIRKREKLLWACSYQNRFTIKT